MKPDYASENKIWFHIQGSIASPNDKSYYAKRGGNSISTMTLVAYKLLDCDLKMDLGMTGTERL